MAATDPSSTSSKALRVLVTGGAGFIGSHVVDRLIALGHHVAILDDFSSGRESNVNPKARVHRARLQDPLDAIFSKEKPDVVFHLAAQIDVRKSVDDPVFDATVNIIGTINLLEACAKHKTGRFIFSSSGGAIYGDAGAIPTPEGEPEQPASPYGIAKLTIEHYLRYYLQTKSLSSCALRYANVYGPRQNPLGEAGVIAIFIHKLLAGESPTINGDGKQTRDYVYVEDVAEANILALTRDLEGSYNVGTGVETDVNELASLLVMEIGGTSIVMHGKGKAGEQRRSCILARKLTLATGWKPKTQIEDGIAKTVAWFKKNDQGRPGKKGAKQAQGPA